MNYFKFILAKIMRSHVSFLHFLFRHTEDHREFSRDKDQSGWVEGRLAREFALKSMDNQRKGLETTLYGE